MQTPLRDLRVVLDSGDISFNPNEYTPFPFQQHILRIPEDITAGQLKELVAEHFGIPVNQQALVYYGLGENQTLRDNDVILGDVVGITVWPQPTITFDFNKVSNIGSVQNWKVDAGYITTLDTVADIKRRLTEKYPGLLETPGALRIFVVLPEELEPCGPKQGCYKVGKNLVKELPDKEPLLAAREKVGRSVGFSGSMAREFPFRIYTHI